MAKYDVTMAVNLRVNIEVEANSFTEAFEKAKSQVSDVDLNLMGDWIDSEPVKAEREDGALVDYGYHPYLDER